MANSEHKEVGKGAPTSQSSSDSLEQLYLKERQKGRLLLATALVAGVIALGSIGYSFEHRAPAPGLAAGRFGAGQDFGGGDMGGPSQAFDVKVYMKSNGSVDTDKIKTFLDNAPAQFKSRLLLRVGRQIDQAEADKTITSDQATKLRDAFGVTAGTSSSTLDDGNVN